MSAILRMGAAVLALSVPVSAMTEVQAAPESGAPGLVLSADGEQRRALALDTRVEIDVSGVIARVRVHQRFRNTGASWAEGVYVCPLPEDAAVNRLRLRIGERVIEGEVREREAAKRAYAKARKAGKRAGLVEQERPNLFTTSVANIAPGESIEVEVGYWQTVRYEDGAFRLRFPLTFTPRYDNGERRGNRPAGAEPRDRTAIHPPFRRSRPDAGFRVRLRAHLRPGVPLAAIESPYHDIAVESDGDRREVHLATPRVRGNRDFVLRWRPQLGSTPRAALLSQSIDGERYVVAMVVPPKASAVRAHRRELVLVVDTSGSMQGASIRQAKAALQVALDRLSPSDRFNVVRFSSTTGTFAPHSVAATRANVERARGFVDSLSAGGGTNMAPALERALDADASPGYLRQVVFVTDGAVANEQALFKRIQERVGRARLFTVGIGSAPNAYFMRRAADYGRGTDTLIGKLDEVEPKMRGLFAELAQPALTDVAIDWPAVAETYPERLPDLYAGEPLIVAARMPEPVSGEIAIGGKLADRDWTRWLKLGASQSDPGVAALWARRKIETVMDAKILGADADWARKEIVATALEHRLVSRYTSLVAIDKTPARSQKAALRRERVANELPAGQSIQLPQTAAGTTQRLWLGLFLLALAIIVVWRLREHGEDTCAVG